VEQPIEIICNETLKTNVQNLPSEISISGDVSVSNFPSSFEVSNFPTSTTISNTVPVNITQVAGGNTNYYTAPTGYHSMGVAIQGTTAQTAIAPVPVTVGNQVNVNVAEIAGLEPAIVSNGGFNYLSTAPATDMYHQDGTHGHTYLQSINANLYSNNSGDPILNANVLANIPFGIDGTTGSISQAYSNVVLGGTYELITTTRSFAEEDLRPDANASKSEAFCNFAVTCNATAITVTVNGTEWSPSRSPSVATQLASATAGLSLKREAGSMQNKPFATPKEISNKFFHDQSTSSEEEDSDAESVLEIPMAEPTCFAIPPFEFKALIDTNPIPHKTLCLRLISGNSPNSKSVLHNHIQKYGHFTIQKPTYTERPGKISPYFTASTAISFVSTIGPELSLITLFSCKVEDKSKSLAEHSAFDLMFQHLSALYQTAGLIVQSAGGFKLA